MFSILCWRWWRSTQNVSSPLFGTGGVGGGGAGGNSCGPLGGIPGTAGTVNTGGGGGGGAAFAGGGSGIVIVRAPGQQDFQQVQVQTQLQHYPHQLVVVR
jgi:hypothetical protein